MFGNEMIEKLQDIYLSDSLSGKVLAASVEDTITQRLGKVKGLMYEVAAIMKYYRMQSLGGMQVAWEIWERSLVPALLANCGSWVKIYKGWVQKKNGKLSTFCG